MTPHDLQQIGDLIGQKLDQKLEPIHKELKVDTKQLKSLNKDQKTMLVLLDTEQMRQRKRITRIEQQLSIAS